LLEGSNQSTYILKKENKRRIYPLTSSIHYISLNDIKKENKGKEPLQTYTQIREHAYVTK
jgi:polyhydroxyalkanoate synthesis regulator protein